MMDSLLRELSASLIVCVYANSLLILVEGETCLELETHAMRMMQAWSDRVGVDKNSLMMLKRKLGNLGMDRLSWCTYIILRTDWGLISNLEVGSKVFCTSLSAVGSWLRIKTGSALLI